MNILNNNLKPSFNRVICVSVVCIAVIIVIIFFIKFFTSIQSFPADSFQAVFLTNNQVYFGKLSKSQTQFPILTDVYYIQALSPQDLSKTDKTGSQLQLVKLGSELHQPQDIMYLNRDQILFIEPLKPTSSIIKSILEFKKNQAQ